MSIVILSFAAVFLLLASGGLLLFSRQGMQRRVSSAISPSREKGDLLRSIRRTGSSMGGVLKQFEAVVPRSDAEASVVEKRLVRAGYRKPSAMNMFYAAKVVSPVVLLLLAIGSGLTSGSVFVYAIAVGVGFLVPDFWLGRRIAARQMQIRLGLPDVLDFLVICIEAGLSMDQATARTGQELLLSQPAISDELEIVVLEQRAGRLRSEAWKQFAERTGVDSVRNLVSVLVQSEQLGTGIAKILRVHSDTLRTQRRQQVEEQAAKTTIKLVFPLVLFIFPSLFLVTLGPEAIMISESFQKYLTH